MKIICIEGNYISNKENYHYPVFSIKPESSLLRNNRPFFIPDHSHYISPRIHLALRISRLGKSIRDKFAHMYYNEIGIGIDMIASDTLEMCRKKRLPWDPAKAYDSSSPIGNFISIHSINNNGSIPFSLKINDRIISEQNSSEMLFHFDKIIEHISKYVILKTGDLIYTGSPDNSYSVKINDRIEGYIFNNRLLWFNVK
ncbi:MAG: fumarylacetoacetate hydrolase family protein [Bacteroidota bacterium]